MRLTRRQWLSLAGASLLPGATPAPLFEEVPASRSGIAWSHDNAMSPERFLPVLDR